MQRTIDQQIAEAVTKAAFKDRALAERLLDLLQTALTRDVDIRDAAPLIADLHKFLGKAP